jgi:putative membrane protein
MSKKLLNIISILIPLLVAILMGLPQIDFFGSWTKLLPCANAIINSLTAIVLISALIAIKFGNVSLHRNLMLLGVVLGVCFLINYIIYHISNEATVYGEEGSIRFVYFTLLITHIMLAIVEVWFVLRALYYALNEDFENHVKVVKIAYPIWLYVSVSGVVIYLMISPFYSI